MYDSFQIERGSFNINNMLVDTVTTFYDKKGTVEGVYYNYKGKCNYLLSWGFNSESLGESKKKKAKKSKMPFFDLTKGWYGYEN